MTDLFGHTTPPEMRALSWKNPFGALMFEGKIETRTWDTKYRGLVLICVSRKWYLVSELKEICGPKQYHRVMEFMINWGDALVSHEGCAIAVGNLVNSRPMQPLDEGLCYVKYNPDLWCHVYEDVRAIRPIPWKGVQGWKILDQKFIKQIEYLDGKGQ